MLERQFVGVWKKAFGVQQTQALHLMCVALGKMNNLSQSQTFVQPCDGYHNFEAVRVLQVVLDLRRRLLF